MRQPTSLFQFRQLLFITVLGMLFSCKSNKFALGTKRDIDIMIVKGIGDSLVLIPDGTAWADKGKKVFWFIGEGSNVDSFGIEIKKGADTVFASDGKPPKKFVKKGKGKVSANAKNYAVYEYSIIWKDDQGIEHKYDPKISVRPN